MSYRLIALVVFVLISGECVGQDAFSWPEGKRAALSLSFDDGRPSQIDEGLPLFARYGASVTYFVVPSAVEQRQEGWRRAVAAGHEIGNHSLRHPCTGNFTWSRERALEDYSLERMRQELLKANRRIEELLGVVSTTFAYPCGQKFVGRGRRTESYVPIVAELFLAGRGWLDEVAVDPAFGDLAQITGVPMDEVDFEQIRSVVDVAAEEGRWLILAGHDIGASGRQTTRVAMLEKLLEYARDPENELWLAPVGTVAEYVRGANARPETGR